MGGYTIKPLSEIANVFEGNYPGEMRFATYAVDAEQVALTFRRMPEKTGGKGSYGHRHKSQEEVYFVLSGALQFKLDDEVIDVPAGTVVRVAPETARSVWNEGPEDAELVIVSVRAGDNPADDVVQVPDFWPA
jgi:mannose-6-phosphate isomerase-like protein (cupin superfamily)